MQALRKQQLWTWVFVWPWQAARTSRRREALRVVRVVELRAWVHIRSEQTAQAWARQQQVHLVWFDLERRGMSVLSDSATREVVREDAQKRSVRFSLFPGGAS